MDADGRDPGDRRDDHGDPPIERSSDRPYVRPIALLCRPGLRHELLLENDVAATVLRPGRFVVADDTKVIHNAQRQSYIEIETGYDGCETQKDFQKERKEEPREKNNSKKKSKKMKQTNEELENNARENSALD